MKFWMENPSVLYKDIKFIPKNYMEREEKMNCITRMIFFIFLIMYLLEYKYSVLFLFLSLFFIIILYYLQRNMTQENYTSDYIKKSEKLYKEGIQQYKKNRYTVEKFPSYYTTDRIKSVEIVPDQTFVSTNQKLVGPANPKTLIAPVVAPPSYDWEYWRQNEFVFPSAINEKRVQDYYGSGYITEEPELIENYEPKMTASKPSDTYYQNKYVTPPNPVDVLGKYNGKYPFDVKNGSEMGSSVFVPKDFRNQSNKNYGEFRKSSGIQKYPGDVNRSCTYDASNIDYDLPTNFMAGNCERNNNVKELNNELFTSTITPGVYYKNQIIEPLNSNIGISFDQQIPPRQETIDKYGNITYTALDPSLYEQDKKVDNTDYGTAPYEVYDPRSNGYGTSYRDYEHEITGQPRFYYDDVNAARRPNYITRTNIDHLLKADSYGIIDEKSNIMSRNCNSRQIAEDGIVNDTMTFRTDMMTRLMRKRNSELWQQRLAPLQKGGNFTLGRK